MSLIVENLVSMFINRFRAESIMHYYRSRNRLIRGVTIIDMDRYTDTMYVDKMHRCHV